MMRRCQTVHDFPVRLSCKEMDLALDKAEGLLDHWVIEGTTSRQVT
jgi:hypothetical protein